MKGIEPSYSAWKAAALPLSYTRKTITHPCLENGRCRIRTYVGVSHRIYSPTPLATRATSPNSKTRIMFKNKSRRRDLNPRPADYKSAALPLSYTGNLSEQPSNRFFHESRVALVYRSTISLQDDFCMPSSRLASNCFGSLRPNNDPQPPKHRSQDPTLHPSAAFQRSEHQA